MLCSETFLIHISCIKHHTAVILQSRAGACAQLRNACHEVSIGGSIVLINPV